jgi:hypothetical protein
MNTARALWKMQRGVAHLVAPVTKRTGYRFSKAWRGNGVVDHIAANLLADGETPFPINEFVWPQKARTAGARRIASH